ncbi:hypothetical protein ACJX0J_040191, partial [Zea mays]
RKPGLHIHFFPFQIPSEILSAFFGLSKICYTYIVGETFNINLYLLVFLISIFGLGMILVYFHLALHMLDIRSTLIFFSHISICDQAFLGLRSIFFNNFLIDFFLLMMHFVAYAQLLVTVKGFSIIFLSSCHLSLNIGPEYVYGAEHV